MSDFDAAAALEALLDPDHPTKRAAAAWAAERLDDPELAQRDVECRFWDEGWDRAAERGIPGMRVDPAYGGGGADLFEALLTFEGLGKGCRDMGLVFALGTQVWTKLPLLERFGTEEQKRRWVPGLCSGELKSAFCITEHESGSDTFSMATTFETEEGPDGPSYVLTGTKAWITLAPLADVFVVFATSDQALGQWGITAFLVPRDTPGLTVGPNRPKMGLRTVPFGDVHFDQCRLGPEAVLGSMGSGAAIFTAAMESERAFVLVGQLGAMERQLAETVAHSRSRRQFGQPIGDFQAVGHRLAEMKLRYENARLQMYRAAMLHATGRPVAQASALAKIQISEASVASSLDAMLTHGARGYVTEFGVEADLRNVAGGVIYAGSSDIQRSIVARLLGGGR